MILICREEKTTTRNDVHEERYKKGWGKKERSDVGCFYPFIISSPRIHVRARRRERESSRF